MKATTPSSQDLSVIALDSVVSRIEAGEHQHRINDAVLVKLFAEALDQAAPENFLSIRAGELVRNGKQSELAYRAIRAELACVLSVSEQTVERRLTHAYELTNYYFETFLVLSEGLIALAHTEVIATAGRVIGEGIRASTSTRRIAYETAVLEHAVRETPARLRPIARRLAEQYTEQTIDERHFEACQERRVWVIDREDGMSDLTAYLPSVEAHAIFDRLTNASKELSRVELRDAAEPDGTQNAASTGLPEPQLKSQDRGLPQPRTRNQLRTDLFSDLLRTSLFSDLVRAGDTSMGAPHQSEPGSKPKHALKPKHASEPAPQSGSNSLTENRAESGLRGVQARSSSPMKRCSAINCPQASGDSLSLGPSSAASGYWRCSQR